MWADLTDEQVSYYRRVVHTHAHDTDSGLCRVCRVQRCPDWLDALDKLAAAGQTMTEPGVLGEPVPERRS